MSLTAPTPDELKSFRKQYGFTQTGLASEIGVSRRAIEEWEAGRRALPVLLRFVFLTYANGLTAKDVHQPADS